MSKGARGGLLSARVGRLLREEGQKMIRGMKDPRNKQYEPHGQGHRLEVSDNAGIARSRVQVDGETGPMNVGFEGQRVGTI